MILNGKPLNYHRIELSILLFVTLDPYYCYLYIPYIYTTLYPINIKHVPLYLCVSIPKGFPGPSWVTLVHHLNFHHATVRQLKKRLLQIGPPPKGWLTQTPGSTITTV